MSGHAISPPQPAPPVAPPLDTPPAPLLDTPPAPPLGSQVGQHSPGSIVETPSQAISGHSTLQTRPPPVPAPARLPPAPSPPVPVPPAPAAAVPENVPPQAVVQSAAAKATSSPCCLSEMFSRFIAGSPGFAPVAPKRRTRRECSHRTNAMSRIWRIFRAGVGTVRHEADRAVRGSAPSAIVGNCRLIRRDDGGGPRPRRAAPRRPGPCRFHPASAG